MSAEQLVEDVRTNSPEVQPVAIGDRLGRLALFRLSLQEHTLPPEVAESVKGGNKKEAAFQAAPN